MSIDFKKIDYRHYICLGLVAVSLCFTFLYFKYAGYRLFESMNDFGNSTIYYFNELFNLGLNGDITVNHFSSVPFVLPLNLPNTWEEFQTLWVDYWHMWASKENLLNYLVFIGNLLFYISRFLLIAMPILAFYLIFKVLKKEHPNNDYDVDTKALKWFKKFEKKVLLPVKHWFIDFFKFFKSHDIYIKLIALIWFYNFNGFSIIIEGIAYYLYFVSSFKTITLYTQVLKLLMDLSVLINFFHTIVWVGFAAIIINIICKKIGYNRLDHMEHMDRGFINERPIVIMLNGTMGSKKTTMITDIAISQEIMFRNKAYEKILDNDLKFPNFPWINLENSLKKAMQNHSVYNLATCKRFVKSKKLKWLKNKKHKRYIFNYNYNRYGMSFDNGLYKEYIWEVIETYVQLYFVYVIESSLIISNYSIRVDNYMIDEGNFPLWIDEIFKTKPERVNAHSRHSHIIDYDMLRLGKKLIEFNDKADCFEFGVINITEIGKERQNTVELKEVKKSDTNANQKNDLFNTWLKMIRHSATIDNFPFVKVICDDQRPESWGADARDLCEIVFIEKANDIVIARPLFFMINLFLDKFINKFNERYADYRFTNGNNTLPMYLYKNFIYRLKTYKLRNYNTFGYFKLETTIESGRQEGIPKEGTYYLMPKKIYSKRFSTDCFSEFFNEKALRSTFGINDLEEFENIKATFEEMLSENSYFFNDLIRLKDN